MKKTVSTLAMLAVMALAAGRAMADDQLSLGTGFDYSVGKYGQRLSTSILYIPFTAKYEMDDSFVKLVVPYISITGPGGVIRGIGEVRPAKIRTATVTNSGLGDIIASAGHTVYDSDALSLDLVGNIKFGTADPNKELGTGENDYSAEVDGYNTLSSKSSLLWTAGYRVYGSPPGIHLNNEPYGSFGFSHKMSERVDAGVMLDYAKSPIATTGDQRDVTAFISKKTDKNTKVELYALKGFASGSPNLGVGAMLIGYF